jgi:hypothetical protein
LTTCRLNGAETPPPGAGLDSVTEAAAPVASEADGTVALSSVELRNVAVRVLSFQDTVVVGRKFVPTISSEMDGLPTGMLGGETAVITGSGFTTLNGRPEEVPPPGAGFVTVIVEFVTTARSAAVRDIVIWVALVNVVGLTLPLMLAVEAGTKPLPPSVTLALARPAAIVEGATPSSTGAGLSTLRATVVLVLLPPPFVTPTWSCAPDTSWPAGTIACNCVALTYTVGT